MFLHQYKHTHTHTAVYLSLDSTDAENKRAPNVNESTAENSPRHRNSYLLLEKRSLTKLQWRAFKGNHGAFYFKRDCIFDLFQRFTFSRSNECTPGCLPETEYEQVQCLASGHSLAAAAGGVRRVSPSTFASDPAFQINHWAASHLLLSLLPPPVLLLLRQSGNGRIKWSGLIFGP